MSCCGQLLASSRQKDDLTKTVPDGVHDGKDQMEAVADVQGDQDVVEAVPHFFPDIISEVTLRINSGRLKYFSFNIHLSKNISFLITLSCNYINIIFWYKSPITILKCICVT